MFANTKQRGIYSEYLLNVGGRPGTGEKLGFRTGPDESCFLRPAALGREPREERPSGATVPPFPIQKLKDLQRVSLRAVEPKAEAQTFNLSSFGELYGGYLKYRRAADEVARNVVKVGSNGAFEERLATNNLLIEPKVMEPYEPVPGRVPRKIVIERKRIQFASFDFSRHLEQSPLIDLLKAFEGRKNSQWIGLEAFEDESFDDYSIGEWLEKAQKGSSAFEFTDSSGNTVSLEGRLFVKANALSLRGQTVSVRPALIEGYDAKTREFFGSWRDNRAPLKLGRIYVCFESEDPKKWLNKLEKAAQLKQKALVKLKENFMVDRMSTDDLNEMDAEQKQRLLKSSGLAHKFRHIDGQELMEEAQGQFQRSMNKIIFENYFAQMAIKFDVSDILALKAEKTAKRKERKRSNRRSGKGVISSENKRESETATLKDELCEVMKTQSFSEVFKEFCFSSLFIKEEAIDALQEVKRACETVKGMRLFSTRQEGPRRLDEFRTIQESSISQVVSHLKNVWVRGLIDIVRRKFSDIGKGWFNMKETNRLTYEFGKLKRFLTVVRLNMQDSLKELLKASLTEFVDFFKKALPETVSVKSQNKVENSFGSAAVPLPLLSLDLVQVVNKEEFNYLFRPDRISTDLLELFEKVIDELKRIPDLEPKILESLHKAKKTETFVITPLLPKEKPELIDPTRVPRRYSDENKWLWDLHCEFASILSRATEPLETFRQTFKPYETVLGLKAEEAAVQSPNDEGNGTEGFKAELKRWRAEEQKLKDTIAEEVQVSCFSVNCKEALRVLTGKYQEVCKRQTEELVKTLKESAKRIQRGFADAEKEVQQQPSTVEEMVNLKAFIASDLPRKVEQLKQETVEWVAVVELLEAQRVKLPKEELAKRWKLLAGPRELTTIVKERERGWDKLTAKFSEQMNSEQEEFSEEVGRIEGTVAQFHINCNLSEHKEMGELVGKMTEKLEEMAATARLFNKREGLLEKTGATDYGKIPKLQRSFAPYLIFWKTVSFWMENKPHWMNDDWETVNAESAEKFVEEELRNFSGVLKGLRERSKGEEGESFKRLLEAGEQVMAEAEEFKAKVPILAALKKQGIRDRHWEELTARTGLTVKADQGTTFEGLLQLGLGSHAAVCVEIGEKASREFAVERSLAQMSQDWESVEVALVKFKDTGSFVLSNFDAIEALLDQHLTDTQTLLVNPFRKPFAEEVDKWYESLLTASNVVEEWRRLQGQWCYLQPIFDSPDISKQLPNESALFKRVDGNWRQALSAARTQKAAFKTLLAEGLLDKLRNENASLDKIQKELRSYLELKRARFGRFYFLSNDDLLSILSETKDVERVQDHLRKVFENIAKLTFTANKQITAMSSVEGETVPFGKAVDPSMRQVEDWMSAVEEAMVCAVREQLGKSVAAYPSQPRTEWILWPPGQCVLNGSQVHWTAETEQAIEGGTLAFHLHKLEEQLKNLVTIERAKLSPNQFVTLEALIVIDVHAKDVVERLSKAETSSSQDFEWVSQLRYYWEGNEARVRCLQTDYAYGYEYLGNTPRLVITPLTDKCYMTLMSAIRLNLGGAPAGPAGTGKTESTKDLAKALAKQCVVFNCQESMDYHFVGKFFKGLASSGAWACFDEFNRINLEVLSVVAQQLQELFRAVAEGSKSISFEGSEVKLKEGFSVFVTMNPGYAGRTELPDNLKALFRPVAMMVPDYALIAEIKLYSFGFVRARELARKMVATFRLASEQLSSQFHYDYGMRAVTSVINAAGLLRRADRTAPEDQLLLRSIRDVNLPKFLKDDIPLFENIVKDLFPTTPRPPSDATGLLPRIKSSCIPLGLEPSDAFLTKVLELYNTTLVRHGLMLVGPAGGGKTSAYRVLQKALGELAKEHPDMHSKVNIEVLNPKSVTMPQLYGEYREMNWNEGVIETVFERAIKAQFDPLKGNERWWVMFDGPVDALWIESMNTVLDDNKKLCLSSGKVLILSKLMTVMFEVEDLKEASPATVSRCGMVYLEPEGVPINSRIKAFFSQLSETTELPEPVVQFLTSASSALVEPAVAFVRSKCKEVVKTVDNSLVSAYCKLTSSLVKENINRFSVKEIDSATESLICDIVVFCCVWSVGCSCDEISKGLFSDFLSSFLTRDPLFARSVTFKAQFYDLKLNVVDGTLKPWLTKEETDSLDFSNKSNYSEIIVPTIDSVRTIFLSEQLLRHGHVVCTPGPPGTGKTTNALSLLTERLGESFVSLSLTFSAQTSAGQVLETIFAQLSKRKRGIYGPPSGKQLVVFVDDMNMPRKEQYGAQPPIELLRELLDHSALYVWKSGKERLKFEDVLLLGAMGPAGGGRAELSQRFARHFNTIAYTDLEQSTIRTIFGAVLGALLKKYSEPVKMAIERIIQASCRLYNRVREDLLPIPGKSHYLFTLRDFSRLMAGVCSSNSSLIRTESEMLELWGHECTRVFHDRLTCTEDRRYFCSQLEAAAAKEFPEHSSLFTNAYERFSIGADRVIFFASSDSADSPYKKIDSPDDFMAHLYEVQKDYNREAGGSRPKVNLVLFLDACEHIAKVARVLRQPQGHSLLLGVGGSGKQSLARLAIYLVGQLQFGVEVVKGYSLTKWREDLKRLVFTALTEANSVAFMISDSQLINEQFVEDLSCLMNSGFLLGLPFNADELNRLEQVAKSDCAVQQLPPNKANLQAARIARFKRNSHFVFCMSPLGPQFVNRLRMFPAITACCTVDWFVEWPKEALRNVARDYLEELEENQPLSVPIPSLTDLFAQSHLLIQEQNVRFKTELGRTNYVTPTSYLELLRTFGSVFERKTKENAEALKRLENGVSRLKEANADVEKLQAQLVEEEPALRASEEEVSQMLERVAADKAIADGKREVVVREEGEAKKAQDEAAELAGKVKAEVDEADRELDKTLEKIGLLNQGHLNEIKSFDNPPPKVKHVFMATCVLCLDASMCTIKPNLTDEEVENFFWKLAKSELLKNPQFLSQLKGINFQKVEMAKIRRIRELVVDHPRRSKTWVEAEMQKSNIANYCLFLLINAVVRFNELFEKTKPLRKQQEEVLAELDRKKLFLAEKNQELAVVTEKLAHLESLLAEKNAEVRDLRAKIEGSTQKLERAQRLTDLLADENRRWAEEVGNLKEASLLVAGNSAIAAVMVNYAGPFTAQFRATIEGKVTETLKILEIRCTEGVSMRRLLAEEIRVLQWHLDGLPKDDCSLENAIVMENSARWSLVIDPQRQAFNFLRNSAKNGQTVQIVKNGSSTVARELEQAVQFGKWLLVENCGAEIDSIFEPVVAKNVTRSGGALQIQLGEKTLPYSEKFRLVLLTAVQNPLFSPEVCAKVSVVNFSITPSGLEEQMLARIVNMENRQLEDQKSDIVTKNVEERQKLLKLEDSILKTLSESKNDFLESPTLLNQLASSKTQSTQIKAKVAESKALEASIDVVRERYRGLARRASILFFCASSLVNADPMYEFSLEWYKELFRGCLESTQTEPGVDRLAVLTDAFTLCLFKAVCRSVFERHKLLFSFLIAIAIMEDGKEATSAEIAFLFSLSFMDSPTLPSNPTKLPEASWKSVFKAVYALSKIDRWKGIDTMLLKNPTPFELLYDSTDVEHMSVPMALIEEGMTDDPIARLLLVKVMRPDRLVAAVQTFVATRLGQQFTEFAAPQLGDLFDDSTQTTPLIVILSPGSDPKADFDKLVDAREIKKVLSISLGQGQGERAEKMIAEAVKAGYWVLLQNCHLAASWMPALEGIVFGLSALIHKDFRLWLTTAPTTAFPVAVLQNSLRMTVEPPRDLRSNLLKSYSAVDTRGLNEKTETYRTLLYGLCFFHAVAQNRKNFGPIGWNIPYQFTLEDLQVSQRMLELYLAEHKVVPFRVLNFVFAEVNYGGRVTDDQDLRLLKSLVRVYLCQEALREGYSYSDSGLYLAANLKDLNEYTKHIRGLPINAAPEAFFLHSNAEIATNQSAAQEFVETALSVRGAAVATNKADSDLTALTDELLLKCPPLFDSAAIVLKFPVEYEESMNTVLVQEVLRYNRLIVVFQRHLAELQKALRGEIGLSEELEQISRSLSLRQVPNAWAYPLGFLSMKPLGSWMEELSQRISFFTEWINKGKPAVYWFPGFFFPQAFITGTLQNYARKYRLAIDRLSFNFRIRDDLASYSVPEPPKDGCYVHGLLLEGASWNSISHLLAEPIPRELYAALPIIELAPVTDKTETPPNTYRCPLYKVLSRAGTLSTTGHSTNFIMMLELPTDQQEDVWIRKGVAAFQSLKD